MSNCGDVWKHSWPCTPFLCEYLLENPSLVSGKVVLELGAGAACLPSLVCARLGAAQVIVTDQRRTLPLIQHNLQRNLTEAERQATRVTEVDWTQTLPADLATPSLILGSDLFFDPSIFEPLLATIRSFLHRNPKAIFLFAYQNRDADWSIEGKLEDLGLKAVFVRRQEATHSLQLGMIMDIHQHDGPFFVGVESGATRSDYVLFDSRGSVVGEQPDGGLNCLLAGVRQTADIIARNVRTLAHKNNVTLPLKALLGSTGSLFHKTCPWVAEISGPFQGMGLAGAETRQFCQKVVDQIRADHGDLAEHIELVSDSVAAIAANFPLHEGGVVLIAGTGSAARLLLPSGQVRCCGGWGHLISDGGSAYWIARRAIQQLFDLADGLKQSPHSTERVETALCQHFDLSDRLQVLDVLYSGSNVKSEVASFCEKLASVAKTDPLAAESFEAAGRVLGEHVRSLASQLQAESGAPVDLNVLIVGSVFFSWDLLKPGFVRALQAHAPNLRVRLFKPVHNPALGAALLAARSGQATLTRPQDKEPELVDCLGPFEQSC